MSKILENIKAAQLSARKTKDQLSAKALTTVIGEVENLAKQKNSKGLNDQTVMKVLKKNMDSVKENIDERGSTEELETELKLLESFYPKMLTVDEIRNIKKEIGATDKKTLMPYLSKNYAGLFDGKVASEIAEE